jgi:GNAT superfamily N-acetyltransferase
MEILIRPERPGDGEGLARVWLDNAKYHAELAPDLFQVPEDTGLAEWMETKIAPAPPADRLSLIAEVDGRLVGFMSARLLEPMEEAERQVVGEVGETRLVINALGVERSHWRQGVGTKLMKAAEDWGRERGATLVCLDTWVESPVSVPFYERRLGYERRQIAFRKRLR